MIATPPIPSVFREATITHLDLPSTCVHQDSAEGAAQLQKEREENNKFRRKSTMAEANAEDFDAAKEKERKKKKVNITLKAASFLYFIFDTLFPFVSSVRIFQIIYVTTIIILLMALKIIQCNAIRKIYNTIHAAYG